MVDNFFTYYHIPIRTPKESFVIPQNHTLRLGGSLPLVLDTSEPVCVNSIHSLRAPFAS